MRGLSLYQKPINSGVYRGLNERRGEEGRAEDQAPRSFENSGRAEKQVPRRMLGKYHPEKLTLMTTLCQYIQ